MMRKHKRKRQSSLTGDRIEPLIILCALMAGLILLCIPGIVKGELNRAIVTLYEEYEEVQVDEPCQRSTVLSEIPAGMALGPWGELYWLDEAFLIQDGDYTVREGGILYEYAAKPAELETSNLIYYTCMGTVYNLTVAQCDSDPNTPACSGYYLTEEEAESLEYIAVSRNLLSRNTPGAPFDCGERVYVTGMDPAWLDGYKIIVDVSGRRTNHVDFLVPLRITLGLSRDVRIYKLESNDE